MSDFICGLASMAGVDVDWCKGVVQGKKIDTPVGAACSSSPTGPILLDVVEDDSGRADASQDAKGDISFWDFFVKPEVEDVGEDGGGIDLQTQDTEVANEEIFQPPLPNYQESYYAYVTPGVIKGVYISDLDNDGFDEIILDDGGAPWFTIPDKLFVFGYDANSFLKQLWNKQLSEDNTYTTSPIIGDFNQDGIKEISQSVRFKGLLRFLHNGDESPFPNLPSEDFANFYSFLPRTLMAKDLTGDGVPEIVATGDNMQLYVLQNTGAFYPGWPQPLKGTKEQIQIGDMNQDGKPEIVTSDEDEMYYWDLNGQLAGEYQVNHSWLSSLFFVGNLDDDPASLEVVRYDEETVSDMYGKCSVYSSSGELLANWPTQGEYPWLMALADLNNDGKDEIIYRSRTNDLGYLYAATFDGQNLPGWPVAAPEGQEFKGYYSTNIKVAPLINGGEKFVLAGTAAMSCFSDNAPQSAFMPRVLVIKQDGQKLFQLDILLPNALTCDYSFVHLDTGDINNNGKIDLCASVFDDGKGSSIKIWEFNSVPEM